MIKLTTSCSTCIHNCVCQYRNCSLDACNKLKSTLFGKSNYDDYDWETMSDVQHFDIFITCKDYTSSGGVSRKNEV